MKKRSVQTAAQAITTAVDYDDEHVSGVHLETRRVGIRYPFASLPLGAHSSLAPLFPHPINHPHTRASCVFSFDPFLQLL